MTPPLLLDGKALAAELRQEMAQTATTLRSQGCPPGLTVILVGENPASAVYVGQKEKAAAAAGFESRTLRLPESVPQAELLTLIRRLNATPEVHGILVQLPLPRHIDPHVVISAIDPAKDVDGLHPVSLGRLVTGEEGFISCTPLGIITLLRRHQIAMAGKDVVIVGRSNIVGKPLALLFLREHATVTICHSRTFDLPGHTRRADVLVAAVGQAGLIRGDMVREGAVVVDVAMNRTPEGKLCGDVDFAAASLRASAITPVPGGVGPMTIAMLLHNTLLAAQRALAR